MASPFLDAGTHTRADSLAIVQLSRDMFQPLYLHDAAGSVVDGYAEGAVLNTRFGSFPHSTLIGVEWGSQVRASVVDTGSRGRAVRKRKRAAGGEAETAEMAETAETTTTVTTTETVTETVEKTTTEKATATETAAAAAPAESTDTPPPPATATPPPPPPVAASGFIHVLPPTAELWTLSLPHRTQVVYTSDYSYILHRLRARPGTHLIEAGSGSGSFTHAAARAVYGRQAAASSSSATAGHVFSFEFHNERYRRMRTELALHGLTGGPDGSGDGGVVTLTNRDVYDGGFLLDDGTSPEAEAVFLDLPAPWRALEHLTRDVAATDAADARPSALHPRKSVYLCSFSPCIEQVTRTVSVLRRLGWVDIDMVEMANKRLLVYRERPEAAGAGPGPGGTPPPGDVAEAVARLQAIEARTRAYNKTFWQAQNGGAGDGADESAMDVEGDEAGDGHADDKRRPPFLDGHLATRVEPEVKTHTSYLVFAVLPRAWTAADEAAAAARWPCGAEQGVIGAMQREERKAQKRQLLSGRHGGGSGGKRARKKRRQEQDAALAAEEELEGVV